MQSHCGIIWAPLMQYQGPPAPLLDPEPLPELPPELLPELLPLLEPLPLLLPELPPLELPPPPLLELLHAIPVPRAVTPARTATKLTPIKRLTMCCPFPLPHDSGHRGLSRPSSIGRPYERGRSGARDVARRIACDAIPLDGEGQSSFTTGGNLVCSCAGSATACQVLSTDLKAPQPIAPATP